MRLTAVNNVIIVHKDHGEHGDPTQPQSIPEPFTGVISSIGYNSSEYSVGDKVAFEFIGGMYMQFDGDEFVILTPNMIIGKL